MTFSPSRDYLAEHLQDMPPFRALIRAIEARLFEEIGPLAHPILDVGCGDGHFASVAFPTPEIGLDLDTESLAQASARGAHRLILRASATELPCADDAFETVVSNCVLEHIPDLNATLGEISRVLRPGGRFAFGVPSHRFASLLLGSKVLHQIGAHRGAVDYGRWFNDHSRHFHTYNPETWHDLLDHNGFDVTSWRYYMTPEGHKAFDIAHYLSVPNLVTFKLTGKWVLWHNRWSQNLLERWLREHYEAECAGEGAYIFFDARRR